VLNCRELALAVAEQPKTTRKTKTKSNGTQRFTAKLPAAVALFVIE
jgi:hypothetical protein